MRCWWCGVEPDALFDVTEIQSAEPKYLANWPTDDDHEHAEVAPSPAQLVDAGHQALMRVRAAASGLR
jgi:hypothetical protein